MKVAIKGWTLLGLLVAVVVFFLAAGATSTRVTGDNLKMWSGAVNTTGTSTITATFSGSVSSIETGLVAQEFSASSGPSTVWGKDTSGGISNLSSTTAPFPKLIPTGTGELYFGYGATDNPASAGTTPGFRYATTSDDDVVAYDTTVSSAVQPTAKQSPAGVSGGLAVLMTTSAPNTAPPTISAVGSLATNSGNNTTSLTTSPRHTGDLLVVTVKSSSPSVTASSVSGGGVTTWTRVAGPHTSYPDVGPGTLSNVFFGLCLLSLLALIVLGAASLVHRRRSRPS